MPDEAATPVSTAPPPKRPRRIRRFLLLLLLAGASYLGWSVYRSSADRRQIKVDYVAKYDEIMRQIPESDRAWPIYRDAILSIKEADWKAYSREFGRYRRNQPEFVESLKKQNEFLDSHQDAIARISEAAARPRYGFIWDDPANAAWFDRTNVRPEKRTFPGRQIVAVSLEYSSKTMELHRVLCGDARRAASIDDRQVLVSDLISVIRLSRQIEREGFVINALIGQLVNSLAYVETVRAISERPELFADEDLKAISDAHGRFDFQDALSSCINRDRMCVEDNVQRMFTDDGNGDGRIAGEDFDKNEAYFSMMGIQSNVPESGIKFLEPFEKSLRHGDILRQVNRIFAGRMETLERGHMVFDEAMDFVRLPSEQRKTLAPPGTTQKSKTRSGKKSICDEPVTDFAQLATYADRSEAECIAVRIAIALERFHRANGSYPRKLKELVPAYLEAVPLDPFDGKPIRFAQELDKAPLLYSVGNDGVDNGGKRPSHGGNINLEEVNTDFILLPVDDPDQHYTNP